MKNVFTIILLFGLIICKAQTTQEEYNYITKGYAVQIESGLDMKKGYTFVDYGKWGLTHGDEHRECIFKGLVRAGQVKPCAIMMIYRRTDVTNGVAWYICIPSPESDDLWRQTLEFVNTNIKDNNSMQNTLIWALMKFAAVTRID